MTEILCDVPAVAGVATTIHCQLLGSGGTWWGLDATGWTMVTALGTILLAFFALTAWLVSRQSLIETRTTAQTSLAEQEKSRQIHALAPYIRAVNELLMHKRIYRFSGPGASEAVFAAADELNRKRSEVHNTGLVWRLHHFKSRQQMKPFEDLEEAILQAHESSTKPTRVTWQQSAGNLMELVMKWQGDPSAREATSSEANMAFTELWQAMGDAEAEIGTQAEQEQSTDQIDGPRR